MSDFPFFPNIPDFPGVPAIPRLTNLLPSIPLLSDLQAIPGVVSTISGLSSLSGASAILSQVTSLPFAPTILAALPTLPTALMTFTALPGAAGLQSALAALPGAAPILSAFNAIQGVSSLLTKLSNPLAPGAIPGIPALGNDGSGVVDEGAQWGIFDSNLNPVITGDSTLRASYVHEYQISDYPTEAGGFQSYNKVQKPYEVKIAFAQGGTIDDVATFLGEVELILAGLSRYIFVSPEVSYPSLSLIHMDYDRSASSGVQLLDVEIWSREVRQAPAPAFSNTANPQGQTPQTGGQVQGQPPTPAQTQAVKGSNQFPAAT